jgi:hypothetical protein
MKMEIIRIKFERKQKRKAAEKAKGNYHQAWIARIGVLFRAYISISIKNTKEA